MTKPIGQRIRETRKRTPGPDGKPLTLEELGARIGTSHAALSMIERGITKEPYPHTLVALARELNSDFGEAWLREYVRPNNGAPRDDERIPGLRQVNLELPPQLDVLGSVPAGPPVEAVQDVETIIFPPQDRPVYQFVVKGYSMQDEGILPGDIVFISACPEPVNGQTVVALIDGETTTLKKWYRRGAKITLKPANPEFSKIELHKGANEVTCIGEYIGLLRLKRRG